MLDIHSPLVLPLLVKVKIDGIRPWNAYNGLTMETIQITTDRTTHAGCGGFLAMSADAPVYIIEHEGLETRLPGVEMLCLVCGERIRSQNQVADVEK
jgi:hypothetical protein